MSNIAPFGAVSPQMQLWHALSHRMCASGFPGEIRNKIYFYIFSDPFVLPGNKCITHSARPRLPQQLPLLPSPMIGHAQAIKEMISYLYSTHIHFLTTDPNDGRKESFVNLKHFLTYDAFLTGVKPGDVKIKGFNIKMYISEDHFDTVLESLHTLANLPDSQIGVDFSLKITLDYRCCNSGPSFFTLIEAVRLLAQRFGGYPAMIPDSDGERTLKQVQQAAASRVRIWWSLCDKLKVNMYTRLHWNWAEWCTYWQGAYYRNNFIEREILPPEVREIIQKSLALKEDFVWEPWYD
jgi:hypothetical protein